MDDLVQWLRAQLDEDERIARACPGNGEWSAEDIAVYGPDLSVEVRAHMAEHDPRRVLAEVDAKRRIIDLHKGVNDYCAECDLVRSNYPYHPCTTLRLLALPYADRPGYREEWRP